MTTTTHTIDAKGKKLGRIATQAAMILMGKNTSSFKKNAVTDTKLTIVNASKIELSEKKLQSKVYRRYSGYPGGLKTRSMEQVIDKKGYKQIFEDAVYGMLPPNKLRSKIMKNLIITE